MKRTVQITKEIFQVGGGQLTSPEDTAIFLINFDGHVALVDTGTGDFQNKFLANIQACGVNLNQIEYLLLTHCHFNNTGDVRKETMKEEAIEFIKHIVIELLAAIITSSVIFSGSSRLITGYWMRWFRTPYIYIWAILVILLLVWIRKRYQYKKKQTTNG